MNVANFLQGHLDVQTNFNQIQWKIGDWWGSEYTFTELIKWWNLADCAKKDGK